MSETVDSLRQRLVGAFVILSLAIIFLPMIFDKPHRENQSVLVPVPPKPEFKTIEIGKPIQPKFKVLEFDSETNKVVEGAQFEKLDTTEQRALVSLPKPSDTKDGDDHEDKAPDIALQGKKESDEKARITTPKVVADSKSSVKESAKTSSSTPKSVNKKVVAANTRPKAMKPKVSHLPVFKNVWMVQLGTFSKASNAYTLRDKLRADGFDGHTKEVLLGGKKAIRVFTGPFVKKREAIKIKKKLDQKYKVESSLIFFDA